MLFALALAFLGSTPACVADEEQIRFVELVRQADVVVRGEVLSLRYVAVGPGAVSGCGGGCIPSTYDGVHLAELDVLLEYKRLGDADRQQFSPHDPPTRRVWVRLDPPNVRELKVGSTAVFLLTHTDSSCAGRTGRSDEHSRVQAAVRRELAAECAFEALRCGSGVLRERVDATGTRIGDLQRFTLPDELTGALSGGVVAPLRADLERALVHTIEKQARPLLELALLPEPGQADAWRLHLRRDGRVRIEGLPEADATLCPLKLRNMAGLAYALLDGDLPPQHSAARIRGAMVARYELTLHTRDGLRRYTVHVDPAAPDTDADGRLASIWSALVYELHARTLPKPIERALDLPRNGTSRR